MARQGRKTNITQCLVWGVNYLDICGLIFLSTGPHAVQLDHTLSKCSAKRKALNPGVAAVKGPWAHLKKNKRITMSFLPRRELSDTRLEENSPQVIVTFKGKSPICEMMGLLILKDPLLKFYS